MLLSVLAGCGIEQRGGRLSHKKFHMHAPVLAHDATKRTSNSLRLSLSFPPALGLSTAGSKGFACPALAGSACPNSCAPPLQQLHSRKCSRTFCNSSAIARPLEPKSVASVVAAGDKCTLPHSQAKAKHKNNFAVMGAMPVWKVASHDALPFKSYSDCSKMAVVIKGPLCHTKQPPGESIIERERSALAD